MSAKSLYPMRRVCWRQSNEFQMPYLHFETNKGRLSLSYAVQRARNLLGKSGGPSSNDQITKELPSAKDQGKHSSPSALFKQAMESLRSKIKDETEKEPSAEYMLIQAYQASQDMRLHLRRTLDQFYYIGMEDTEDRDTDQVIQRYAIKKALKKASNKFADLIPEIPEHKLLMVDQLWLWIIGEGWSHILCSDFSRTF